MKINSSFGVHLKGCISPNSTTGETLRDLPEKYREKMEKIIYNTKGLANTDICLELCLAGVDSKTVEKVAKTMAESGYYMWKDNDGNPIIRKERRIPSGKPLTGNGFKQYKKNRGHKDLSTRFSNTYMYRAIDKILGEDLVEEIKNVKSCSFDFKSFASMLVRGSNVELNRNYASSYLSMDASGVKVMGNSICNFIKYEEEKRKAIVDNDFTKKMLATGTYSNYVPNRLKDETGITESEFVKKQVLAYYGDLYWLSQTNIAEKENIEHISSYSKVKTLASAGYQRNAIKDSKTMALLEVAQISLAQMGLTVYYYNHSDYTSHNSTRNYKRFLQKIVSSYKMFDKLMKQGFDAETARETVKQQLEFSISDGNTYDEYWKVIKINSWEKPAKAEPKKKSSNGGKKKVPTIAELKSMMKETSDES